MELLSLRDPAGQLFQFEDRLVRAVHRNFLETLDSTLNSKTILSFTDKGRFVATKRATFARDFPLPSTAGKLYFAESDIGAWVEHEKVRFVSFPYEWAPEMLHAAAELTLDLAENLNQEGLGLKDATPYNILFSGVRPVFVDVLSVEKRAPGDPLWLAYAQFVKMFLNPLLLYKYFNIAPHTQFLMQKDGVQPEDVWNVCGALRRWFPPFLGLTTLPTLFSSKQNEVGSGKRPSYSPEKATFILEYLYKRSRKTLQKLSPIRKNRDSSWNHYLSNTLPYTDPQFAEKETFVSKALEACKPASVLDVGCNTGHFSVLSAERGASVVAIDYDPVVVGETWKVAAKKELDILPLVLNLARPSPAVGWQNSELSSFLERSKNKFDFVLMLAVIHHLLVTEGIPLVEVVRLASDLTTRFAVLEFVAPGDEMFQKIAVGRNYDHITKEAFEAACKKYFKLNKTLSLKSGNRTLYLFEKV